MTLKNADKRRLERAKELRDLADRLEAEARRKLPKQWEIGMRVRFLHDKPWAWKKGQEAMVVDVREDQQVFTTEPDSKKARWWTTTNDVELVDE